MKSFKFIILIVVSSVVQNCALNVQETGANHVASNPFEVVVKFNSLLESCNSDSTVLEYADVEQLFSSVTPDSLTSMYMWKQFVKGSCELVNTRKITNIKHYYEYDISTSYEGNKAVVTMSKVFNENVYKEVYYLKIINSDWIIFKFENQ